MVHRQSDGSFTLHAATPEPEHGRGQQDEWSTGRQGSPAASAEQPLGTFDAVIVATPLESSGIVLAGFEPPHIPARKYRQVGPPPCCCRIYGDAAW